MDNPTTVANRDESSTKKEGAMATNITVTVTPSNPNANKEVKCQLQVAPPQYLVDGAIWIDATKDYNITFNLPGGGPRTWNVGGQPFSNMKGQCPGQNGTTQNGFNVTSKGPTAITVYIPAQGGQAVQYYRMNFEDDYWCDPIIVVG
jgi:hypothetical protein